MGTDKEIAFIIWCAVIFIISLFIRLKYLKHYSIFSSRGNWTELVDVLIGASGLFLISFLLALFQ